GEVADPGEGADIPQREAIGHHVEADHVVIVRRWGRPAEEAIKCHAAGCYRASALMIRRLLEELCADKNAKGDDLKKRLAALSQTIIVPQGLLAAADELRILGNDAAHIEARTYDQIEKDEAELAIDLAKELLKAVYQYTSLLDRLRKHQKPTAGQTTPTTN